jgi:cell division protein FtsL
MAIEVHIEKRINNSNVVRETDSGHRWEYLLVTLLGGLFLAGLFFYAWQQYQWIQYGYRIEEAQKKREQLAEAARQLRLERASLRNPQRIDAIARGELGMVVPVPGQLVTFRPQSPAQAPGPAPEAQPVTAELAKR